AVVLGELRTICLDKYIQTSVRSCRTGRLAQGTCVTISRIPQGQRLLSLDLSTRFVHNYKDTPGPASAEMPDGKRFTPACAPPAGPGGSGRRSPTSPDGGGPTFPRQRVLRPERPGPGQIPLARQMRGNAEPGEPRLSVRAIHQDIGRLDVLVDKGALVRLAHGRRDADGEAQEASRLHRFAHEPLQRLAARILEQQRGSAVFADKRKRPRSPCGVEFVPQFIFVDKALENDRQRAIRQGQHRQHRPTALPAVRAPSPAEDAFVVLPQNLEISLPISPELKGWVHFPDSAAP